MDPSVPVYPVQIADGYTNYYNTADQTKYYNTAEQIPYLPSVPSAYNVYESTNVYECLPPRQASPCDVQTPASVGYHVSMPGYSVPGYQGQITPRAPGSSIFRFSGNPLVKFSPPTSLHQMNTTAPSLIPSQSSNKPNTSSAVYNPVTSKSPFRKTLTLGSFLPKTSQLKPATDTYAKPQSVEEKFKAKASQYGIEICTTVEQFLRNHDKDKEKNVASLSEEIQKEKENLKRRLSDQTLDNKKDMAVAAFQLKASSYGISTQTLSPRKMLKRSKSLDSDSNTNPSENNSQSSGSFDFSDTGSDESLGIKGNELLTAIEKSLVKKIDSISSCSHQGLPTKTNIDKCIISEEALVRKLSKQKDTDKEDVQQDEHSLDELHNDVAYPENRTLENVINKLVEDSIVLALKEIESEEGKFSQSLEDKLNVNWSNKVETKTNKEDDNSSSHSVLSYCKPLVESKLNPGSPEFKPLPKRVVNIEKQLNPGSPEFTPTTWSYGDNYAETLLCPNAPVFQPSLHVQKVSAFCKTKNACTQTVMPEMKESHCNTRRIKTFDQSIETRSCDKREVSLNTVESYLEDDMCHLPPPNDIYDKLITTQRDLIHLRGKVCLDEIEKQIKHIENSRTIWTDYFSSENDISLEKILEERLSALKCEMTSVKAMIHTFIDRLDKGEILSEVPCFTISLPLSHGVHKISNKEKMPDLPKVDSFQDFSKQDTLSGNPSSDACSYVQSIFESATCSEKKCNKLVKISSDLSDHSVHKEDFEEKEEKFGVEKDSSVTFENKLSRKNRDKLKHKRGRSGDDNKGGKSKVKDSKKKTLTRNEVKVDKNKKIENFEVETEMRTVECLPTDSLDTLEEPEKSLLPSLTSTQEVARYLQSEWEKSVEQCKHTLDLVNQLHKDVSEYAQDIALDSVESQTSKLEIVPPCVAHENDDLSKIVLPSLDSVNYQSKDSKNTLDPLSNASLEVNPLQESDDRVEVVNIDNEGVISTSIDGNKDTSNVEPTSVQANQFETISSSVISETTSTLLSENCLIDSSAESILLSESSEFLPKYDVTPAKQTTENSNSSIANRQKLNTSVQSSHATSTSLMCNQESETKTSLKDINITEKILPSATVNVENTRDVLVKSSTNPDGLEADTSEKKCLTTENIDLNYSEQSPAAKNTSTTLESSEVKPTGTNSHGESDILEDKLVGSILPSQLDPVLFEAVKIQIAQVYPAYAKDVNVLNSIALQQTMVLQACITSGGNPGLMPLQNTGLSQNPGFPGLSQAVSPINQGLSQAVPSINQGLPPVNRQLSQPVPPVNQELVQAPTPINQGHVQAARTETQRLKVCSEEFQSSNDTDSMRSSKKHFSTKPKTIKSMESSACRSSHDNEPQSGIPSNLGMKTLGQISSPLKNTSIKTNPLPNKLVTASPPQLSTFKQPPGFAPPPGVKVPEISVGKTATAGSQGTSIKSSVNDLGPFDFQNINAERNMKSTEKIKNSSALMENTSSLHVQTAKSAAEMNQTSLKLTGSGLSAVKNIPPFHSEQPSAWTAKKNVLNPVCSEPYDFSPDYLSKSPESITTCKKLESVFEEKKDVIQQKKDMTEHKMDEIEDDDELFQLQTLCHVENPWQKPLAKKVEQEECRPPSPTMQKLGNFVPMKRKQMERGALRDYRKRSSSGGLEFISDGGGTMYADGRSLPSSGGRKTPNSEGRKTPSSDGRKTPSSDGRKSPFFGEPLEDEDEWTQVTKKGKKTKELEQLKPLQPCQLVKSSQSFCPPRLKNTQNFNQQSQTANDRTNNFERLVNHLLDIFQGLTREGVIDIITAVRNKKRGLSGLTVKEIVAEAQVFAIEARQKSAISTHAVVSPPTNPGGAGCLEYSADAKNNAEDEEICVICHDALRLEETKNLDCGHVYHAGCIKQWVYGREMTCPTCRRLVLFPEEFPKLGK